MSDEPKHPPAQKGGEIPFNHCSRCTLVFDPFLAGQVKKAVARAKIGKDPVEFTMNPPAGKMIGHDFSEKPDAGGLMHGFAKFSIKDGPK